MNRSARWPSLLEALRRQDVADVELWLNTPGVLAHRDWAGQAPLHAVPTAGLARRLLAAGAEVHARDNAGLTALDMALRRGRPGVALALLEAGAEISPTALHWASWRTDARVVKKLLDRGCSVSALDAQGRTPLHWVLGERSAVRKETLGIVQCLVASGAQWDVSDRAGKTPAGLLVAQQKKASARWRRTLQWIQSIWRLAVGHKALGQQQRLRALASLVAVKQA